jgi:iron complex transport system ATP-binding protein
MTILGRAMVQKTEAILLDEPTNHLDVRRQILMLDLLGKTEKLIVAVFHDLNLASKHCGTIILLGGGKIFKSGTPDEIITKENIMSVYGQEVGVIRRPVTSRPVVLV